MSAADDLSDLGTSIWLDDLSRDLLGGELTTLVRDARVVGVTSNPTIFASALGSDAYDEQIADLRRREVGVEEAVRLITAADVRRACDVLMPAFTTSGGLDGVVSLEVDPRLAHEVERTVAEARATWWLVDRPNLLVKIPATPEGVRAVEQCVSEGIDVNVTLVFSLARYRDVVEAYLRGLERAQRAGLDLRRITSVASFFVSRVDTAVDPALRAGGHDELTGRVGVANARLAYAHHLSVLGSDRWAALAASGANAQRPLWASTGVKDPALPDTHYVEELAGPGVVDTMPRTTLDALLEHGSARVDRLSEAGADAGAVLDALGGAGVDLDEVTARLEVEGVEKFERSWHELTESVRGRLSGDDDKEQAAGREPAGADAQG